MLSSAVLLTEPEEATRSFLERHLSQDGFDVVEAENGEALDLLEQARPDLVLIGDPEGLRALPPAARRRAGRSWDREVPVILLGRPESDPVDRVRAFDRGCDDYLDRPFHYDELVARIRAVLRRVAPPEPERLEAGEIEIDRPTRRVTVGGRASRAPDEGVRAAAQARERPASRVHEGGAAPRRLGLPGAGADAHARLARVTPSPPRLGGTRTSRTSGASATACSATSRRLLRASAGSVSE